MDSTVFAALVAGAFTLIGASLGYYFSLKSQESTLNKQRKWALDDQLRQWKRNELEKFSQGIARSTSIVQEIVWSFEAGLVDDEQMKREKIRELTSTFSAVVLYEVELKDVFEEWANTLNNYIHDPTEKNYEKFFESRTSLLDVIRHYYEDTFNPNSAPAKVRNVG